MEIKTAAFMTALGLALAALATPFVGLRAAAFGSAALPVRAIAKAVAFTSSGLNVTATQSERSELQRELLAGETSGSRPNTGDTPIVPIVTSCHLGRQDTGQFFLDVTGTSIRPNPTVTVGGATPKKVKVIAVEPGTANPTTLRLVKKVCNGLPGNVIITNTGPGATSSPPFLCTEKCPT